MSKIPKFRLFAGPNGSGKTTLINTIGADFNLGVFINADILEYELAKKGFLDLEAFLGKPIPKQSDWNEFFNKYREQDKRSEHFDSAFLKIQEGVLVWDGKINSYLASIVAAFFRFWLLRLKKSFSFETVMSHPSKLDFISEAKSMGFKCYLYFICTDDPSINVLRVKNRTEMGGHDVPSSLIESRYFRSLELVKDAFLLADRAFVIDSSNRNRNLILEKDQGKVTIHSETIPGWVDEYLISKLTLSRNS